MEKSLCRFCSVEREGEGDGDWGGMEGKGRSVASQGVNGQANR